MTLRGGGCANSVQTKLTQVKNVVEENSIQQFIKGVSQRCENIYKYSNNIGLQEGQQQMLEELKWFSLCSQYINQINRSDQMVQNNIILFIRNLGILFDSAINILQSQKYLGLQLLKICNQFSRLIFIYYINNPNPPMKVETQQQLQQQLKQIELIEDANAYSNSIIYEYTVIRMCIDTCPTNSQKGQEILINSFKGVISSIIQMSPSTELLKSLGEGALYIFNENQKSQQKQLFRIILYIEELKWQIIEQIQNGRGFRKIFEYINQNYKILVENSEEWIIKSSWIKIVSEIIVYKPIISKQKYNKLASQFELQVNWEQLIQENIIKLVDIDLALIKEIENNSQIGRIFKQQTTTFDSIRIAFLEGSSGLKKFDDLITNNQKQTQRQDFNSVIQVQQCLDNLSIDQIIMEYGEILNQVNNYNEDLIFDIKGNDLYIAKIEQLISYNVSIEKQLLKSMVGSSIIQLELNNIVKINQKDELIKIKTAKYIVLQLIKQYFVLQQENDIPFIDGKEGYEKFVQQMKDQKIDLLFYKSEDILNQVQNKIVQSKDFNQILTFIDQEIEISQKSNKSEIQIISVYLEFLDQIQKQYLMDVLMNLNIQLVVLQSLKQGSDKLYMEQLENQKYQNSQWPIIIQLIIILYKDIDILVKDLKLNDEQLKQFKPLQISDLILFNVEIVNERAQYLRKISNKYIESIKQNGSDQGLNILKSSKHILNQYEKLFVQYQNIIIQQKENLRQVIQIIKSKDDQQVLSIQLKDNNDKFIKLSQKSTDNNQKLDLKQLIDERVLLIRKTQLKYQNLSEVQGQLQQELQYLNLVLHEGIEQNLEELSPDITSTTIANHNKLLNLLQISGIDLNSEQNQDQYKFLQQILEVYDNLVKKTSAQKILSQRQEIQQVQQNINKLIIQFTSYLYQSKKTQDDDKFKQLNAQIKNIVDFTCNILNDQNNIGIDKKIIEDICKQLIDEVSSEVYNVLLPKENNYIQASRYKQTQQQQIAFIQRIQDLMSDNNWRIKEYFYFNCLQIHSQASNSNVKSIIGQIILYGRFKEVDYRVLLTLKNKENIQQMEQLINSQWNKSENDIKSELQKTLNELQQIQLQLQGEEKKVQRDKLIQQHKQLEQLLEQQMKNINEIGDILGVTIHFLKDIKKDLAMIQQKLDMMQEQIDQIGQDIRFLKGKSCQQLLEIRMEQVIQNKFTQESQSVYVEIEIKKYDFTKMQEEQNSSFLFKSENGEINKFLNQNKQTSLLIHGQAGAGKSITARKIEEFLWLQYSKTTNNQQWNQLKVVPLVPIFVQLPTLKEPKFLAIEESLQSLYRFDQKQIEQLREQLQIGLIQLIFIFDSYDELSNQYQGVNLIRSNKLNQWKPKNDRSNPKVITTSRTEAFTKQQYRSWFWESNELGYQSMVELRLMPFKNSQVNEFLHQFSLLKLLLQIKDLLEIITKQKQQDVILQNTLEMWNQAKLLIQNQKQSGFLLNNQNSQQIIQIIKQHPNVILLNQEQEESFLKSIKQLWNKEQYQKCIQQMELTQILETPFMMNIVVEVLPQMNARFSSLNHIKQKFKQTYIKSKEQQINSIILISQYTKTQLYNQNEIDQLENILKNKRQIELEANQVWDYLVETNFFSNFNAQQNQIEILSAISIIRQSNNIKFQKMITEKERDVDNYSIIAKALKSRSTNIYDFFEAFINHYIESQRQKLIYAEINDLNQFQQDIQQYALKLAVLMTNKSETVIERKVQGLLFSDSIQDDYQEFFQDQDKYANYRKLIRKCLPIKQKSNFYSFQHKSIQEYLFAASTIQLLDQISKDVTLKEEINRIRQGEKQQLKNSFLLQKIKESPFNFVQIKDQFLQGALKFIMVALQNNTELQEACYQLILLSSVDDSFIQLSSNILNIIANVKQFIWDSNFSKIKIQNISLDGLGFLNCDFSQSQFKNVSLFGMNLNFSNLKQVSWIDCNSNNFPTLKGPINLKVLSCCYSLNEQLIITGSSDGYIRIWDKLKAVLIKEYQAHPKHIQFVSQWNNQSIISIGDGEENQVLRIWNCSTYKQDCLDLSIIYNEDLKLVSHNLNYLVIGNTKNSLQVYDIKLTLINSIGLEFINAIQIKQDTQELFVYQQNKSQIQVWDYIKNQIICESLLQEILNVKSQKQYFNYDCSLLVALSATKLLTIYNIQDKSRYQPKGVITNFQDIQRQQNNQLQIMDLKTKLYLSQPINYQEINCICFSQNNKELIIADDSTIKYCDLRLLHNQPYSKKDYLSDVTFSQDGLQIYYILDKIIHICDAQSGELLDQINLDTHRLVLNCDGKQLITSSQSNYIIYDIYQRKIIQQFNLEEGMMIQSQNGQLMCILFSYSYFEVYVELIKVYAFSQDQSQLLAQSEQIESYYAQFNNNNLLYYCSGYSIKVMKINMQQEYNNFEILQFPQFDHQNKINDFVIRSDDNQLVSVSQNVIYVWDLYTNIQLFKVQLNNDLIQVKYSFNNDHLIIAEQNCIFVIDSKTYKQIGGKLAGHKAHLTKLIISPSGLQFISLSQDYSFKLWDLNQNINQYIERFMIPQIKNPNVLINECETEGSQIISHQGYNLLDIWNIK
ncbi:hypothetical protein pb186bvf_014328 [Paramecium bursaria]